MSVICKNCESVTSGKYCSNCGQRTSINKVTFIETFQDFIDAVFSVNSPLLLTLKLLIINPGKLFREYLNGKRKMYYKPVPFFILSTIIFLLVIGFFDFNPFSNGMKGEVESDKVASIIKLGSEFFARNINNILLIYVFALGVLLKLFFYKKYSLAEYIAISFYLGGFYTIISCLSISYLKFLGEQFGGISIFVLVVYVIYALISFFESRSFSTIIKIILVFLISFVLFSLLGYLLSFFIIWIKSN